MNYFTSGVDISRAQALNEIYHCFEMRMKGERILRGERILKGSTYSINADDDDDDDDDDENDKHFWGNEFFFRDSFLDEGQEIFRLVCNDDVNEYGIVFSDGIREFREKTHVIFREVSFGLMWKNLPLTVSTFQKGFDGCFTENYNGIMEDMNIVNQLEQFGAFLDVTIEKPKYILWTNL